MNIVDPIIFQCRRQPPAAAICVPGPGIGLISYRRLDIFIHNISRRLSELGLSRGHVIAVNIDDVIFHAALLLAATRLGIATISLRQGDLAPPIRVSAIITTSKEVFAPGAHVVLADLSWTEGDGRPLESHRLPQTNESDICRIIFTSGTTSRPKAVAISHRLLADRINRHLSVFGNRLPNCYRIYTDVPISSSLGFQFMIYTLWRGGTVFFPGENFESTLRVFEEYKVQCLIGSPGGFETLLKWFELYASYQSNIELMFCGGDVLSRSLSDRLRARICTHLVAAYGSTEASMSAAAHAREITEVPRAVGYVTPGVTIQIVDDSGTVLPPDQEGSVRIRSQFAVNGYLGNPEESAEVFRDGWFYPGDLGTLRPDNLLVITGREQTVLNLAGDKIKPEAVELVLSQFAGIAEAAAIAEPNEYGNNELRAVIVGSQDIDERRLRAHCEAHLPRQFVPSKFYFANGLPHNEMGKIDRARLQDLVERIKGGRALP